MTRGRLIYILTNEIPWWFRHRLDPRHRYHVIRTGMPPGWVDREELLAVLMVKMLVDFFEGEKPFEWFDIEASHNRAEWYRLRGLYEYFRGRHPETIRDIPHEELTEKLTEIVRLRDLMWT
jgi:hypothetical protein